MQLLGKDGESDPERAYSSFLKVRRSFSLYCCSIFKRKFLGFSTKLQFLYFTSHIASLGLESVEFLICNFAHTLEPQFYLDIMLNCIYVHHYVSLCKEKSSVQSAIFVLSSPWH